MGNDIEKIVLKKKELEEKVKELEEEIDLLKYKNEVQDKLIEANKKTFREIRNLLPFPKYTMIRTRIIMGGSSCP